MSNNNQFGSKIGLIAATVGSSVGLGNVWRFPAETQANGGAAFLLLYVGCVFLLGIPVMLCEFSLGRGTRSDAIGAFSKLTPKSHWWIVGMIAVIASFLILSYYMVVAGWTLEYLIQSLTGQLYSENISGTSTETARFVSQMKEFISSDFQPLIATYIALGVNFIVLIMGVQKGIERVSNILMPMLFVLLLIFCGKALTLPKAYEGLMYFFNPDFSKITPSVAINALGQAFFSLSLGMGILITYSSYFKRSTNLVNTAVTVSMLDMLVAVMMGVLIFPAVVSFGLGNHQLEGSTLVFVTLPEVFNAMPGTTFWSALFFLLLFIAALTSTISLGEVSISYIINHFKIGRVKACIYFTLSLAVFSTLCSLSQGSLAWFKIVGMNIFDFLDTITTNIMLPVAAFFTCIYLGWIAPRGFMKKELNSQHRVPTIVIKSITSIVKYVAPLLILTIFISNFYGD